MNQCYTKEILLKYINKTATLKQMVEIRKHLKECKVCFSMTEDLKEQIESLDNLLNSVEQKVEIPQFKEIIEDFEKKKTRNKTILYNLLKAAAVVILIISSTLYAHFKKNRDINKNEEIYLNYTQDLNSAFHDNSISVIIYDKNGNVLEVQ